MCRTMFGIHLLCIALLPEELVSGCLGVYHVCFNFASGQTVSAGPLQERTFQRNLPRFCSVSQSVAPVRAKFSDMPRDVSGQTLLIKEKPPSRTQDH